MRKTLLSLALLIGCADHKIIAPFPPGTYISELDLMLPKGYSAKKITGGRLRNLAGVYEGKVKLSKNCSYIMPKIYLADDGYLLKVLKDADVDNDKFVTREECSDLERKICEKVHKIKY